jgi:EAL domain-containing protein (putative c-di-GMP-specific phosphodiesterase class I)
VAEYVDSQEIFDLVKSMGVDYSQGFYIGQPSAKI